MAWGDDYELLFALPPDQVPAACAFAIGRVQEYSDTNLLLDGVAPPGRLGYRHDRPAD
jgi:thiamine-monophosphate kinase